jgi:hypothetical protein
MKVILIEEDRFAEVMDILRLECLNLPQNGYLRQQTGMTESQVKFAADEMFRRFNFHFVRWAQSHGASCVKR